MTAPQLLPRRSFLALAGLSAMPPWGQLTFPAGVQLYTVRELLAKRPLETLQAIAAIGYQEVEMLRSQVELLAPQLSRLGLRPISLHFETPLLTGNWTAWQRAEMPPVESGVTYESAVALARDHRFQSVVFNYLAPEERLGLDFYRSLADKLNAAAHTAQAAGLRFCYHNHDFEFELKPGGRPMDILLARLDQNLIRLEVDVFWVSMAGVDAAAFLREHAKRIAMVHLKDRAPGTPAHYDIATVPNETFRELGNRDLPLREIFKAIAQTRAQHIFAEQDFSTNPLKSLQQSYTYLKTLGVLP